MTAGWLCDRCAMASDPFSSLADLRRYVLADPRAPEERCTSCGDPLPEDVRIRLLLEQAVGTKTPRPTSPSPRPQVEERATAPDITPGALYGLREVARRLRIDRSSTLARAIALGLIRAVRKGRRMAVPGDELLRLLRDGLPEFPDGRTPARSPERQARRAAGARPLPRPISEIPLD